MQDGSSVGRMPTTGLQNEVVVVAARIRVGTGTTAEAAGTAAGQARDLSRPASPSDLWGRTNGSAAKTPDNATATVIVIVMEGEEEADGSIASG